MSLLILSAGVSPLLVAGVERLSEFGVLGVFFAGYPEVVVCSVSPAATIVNHTRQKVPLGISALNGYTVKESLSIVKSA